MKAQAPSRANDYAAWYNRVVKEADLAENSGSRGALIIKPYGFAIWEEIKNKLDAQIKATGHENVYFPLLIPASYFTREAEHIEGFAKECAVVTHYRLRTREGGKSIMPDPDSRFEEPLIIRPTSETIIWDSFSRWVQSYRDLPLLINQWANVVRMEMRTRPFIRTREILWQEGHTAHATAAEAEAQARKMLEVYQTIICNDLAIPIVVGTKTAHEKFAGAVTTYTMEALMQDGKALQLGTSHFLGQNFAKAFGVKFADESGNLQYVWGTSWGLTTRLIGALIMTHGDDRGLILPPKIAPIQVVIIPIYKKGTNRQVLLDYAEKVKKELLAQNIRVKLDTRDTYQPGWKFAHYECKGVPIRLVVGPRDVDEKTVELTRRDQPSKQSLSLQHLSEQVLASLDDLQTSLYQKALQRQKENTHQVDTWPHFQEVIAQKRGFIYAPWDGETSTETAIQAETKATIRCIPLSNQQVAGKQSIYTNQPAHYRALFAQAY